MIYAYIENDKVSNVAEWIGGNIPAGWEPTEDKDVAIGDTFTEGVFLSPEGEPRKNTTDRLQDLNTALSKLGLSVENIDRVRALIDELLETVDDKDAQKYAEIISEWERGIKYTAGKRVKLGEYLYRCLQEHTSQDDWKPGVAPSLWTRIDDPAIEWPEWRQPQGAHDAYAKGAKVTYSGKHWISTADGNVWAPGVYGWEEQK